MLGPTQAALLHVEQPSITQSRWIAAIFIGMVADKAGTCARAPWTRMDSVSKMEKVTFIFVYCLHIKAPGASSTRLTGVHILQPVVGYAIKQEEAKLYMPY